MRAGGGVKKLRHPAASTTLQPAPSSEFPFAWPHVMALKVGLRGVQLGKMRLGRRGWVNFWWMVSDARRQVGRTGLLSPLRVGTLSNERVLRHYEVPAPRNYAPAVPFSRPETPNGDRDLCLY